jgi:hypothetical protein
MNDGVPLVEPHGHGNRPGPTEPPAATQPTTDATMTVSIGHGLSRGVHDQVEEADPAPTVHQLWVSVRLARYVLGHPE